MDLLPENMVQLSAAVTQPLQLTLLHTHGIALDVLRLDKIDPVISGNKWFKLQYYLRSALENGQQHLLTFGGAWSNHLVATACAAKKAGLSSIGIVRGEQPVVLSATLRTAIEWGMQLVFVRREVYNQKNDPAFIEQLARTYHHPCIIPAGGEGEAGIKGAAEILRLTNSSYYSHIICAVGTGTLLAGLTLASQPHQQLMGIPVLKGFHHWRPADISGANLKRVHILPDHHFGGYAKKTEALLDFMNGLYKETGIPTDFVYTGKLFFSVIDLIKKNYFPTQSSLLVIHSGGLQGNDSLPPGRLIF